MDSKEEIKKLLSDTTWERQECPVTKGSKLIVDLFVKKAFEKQSAVEIPGDVLQDEEMRRFVKEKRIKIVKKKKKMMAYLLDMGKLVAAGEISLRRRERKNGQDFPSIPAWLDAI